MARTVTYMSVFLASPSDVEEEREQVENVIDEWNKRHGREKGFIFDLLRWETSVSVGFGTDGQNVVNDQIGDDYDLLIALLWSRLGTKTPRATSGTVEEYQRALERHTRGERVEIAFLFKDALIDFRKTDMQQLQAVKDFEKSAQDAGAFTKSFKDNDGLRFEVSLLLDRIARDALGEPDRHSTSQPSPSIHEKTQVQSTKMEIIASKGNESDDIGLIDSVEDLQEHASKSGIFLDAVTIALNKLTDVTSEVTADFEEIRKVRSLEPSETKPGIRRVSEAMNEFSELIEGNILDYDENVSAMAEDMRNMIRVSYDFINSDSDMLESLWSFRTLLSTLSANMASSSSSLSEFVETTASLQRMTTQFNKSRRRLINGANGMIEITEKARSLVNQALDEINRLIVIVEARDIKKLN